MTDRHTQLRIVLGAITEYAIAILGALKLLQLAGNFAAWLLGNIPEWAEPPAVVIGCVSPLLVALVVLWSGHSDEEYEENKAE